MPPKCIHFKFEYSHIQYAPLFVLRDTCISYLPISFYPLVSMQHTILLSHIIMVKVNSWFDLHICPDFPLCQYENLRCSTHLQSRARRNRVVKKDNNSADPYLLISFSFSFTSLQTQCITFQEVKCTIYSNIYQQLKAKLDMMNIQSEKDYPMPIRILSQLEKLNKFVMEYFGSTIISVTVETISAKCLQYRKWHYQIQFCKLPVNVLLFYVLIIAIRGKSKVYQLLAHGRWFSPGTPPLKLVAMIQLKYC